MLDIQKKYKMRAELNSLIINYLLKNEINFNSCENMHQSKIIFYSYKDAKKALQYLFKTQRKYYYFISACIDGGKKQKSYKSKITFTCDEITEKITNYYIYY